MVVLDVDVESDDVYAAYVWYSKTYTRIPDLYRAGIILVTT